MQFLHDAIVIQHLSRRSLLQLGEGGETNAIHSPVTLLTGRCDWVASPKETVQVQLLNSFVWAARTHTGQHLKALLLVSLLQQRERWSSEENGPLACALESAKARLPGLLVPPTVPVHPLPSVDDIRNFSPVQLHRIVSSVGERRLEGTPRNVVFTEDPSLVTCIFTCPPCLLLQQQHVEVSIPLTLTSSLLLNRLNKDLPLKTGVALFVSLVECGDWRVFIKALTRTKTRVIFVQQQVDEGAKELLANARIFFFDRLGKVRSEQLSKDLQIPLCDGPTDFVVSDGRKEKNSKMRLGLTWQNDVCKITLETRRPKLVGVCTTNEHHVAGSTIALKGTNVGMSPHLFHPLTFFNREGRRTLVGRDTLVITLVFLHMCLSTLLQARVPEAACESYVHAVLSDGVFTDSYHDFAAFLRAGIAS